MQEYGQVRVVSLCYSLSNLIGNIDSRLRYHQKMNDSSQVEESSVSLGECYKKKCQISICTVILFDLKRESR